VGNYRKAIGENYRFVLPTAREHRANILPTARGFSYQPPVDNRWSLEDYAQDGWEVTANRICL